MDEPTHYEARDRRLTIGNLIATIGLGAGLLAWAMQMNERLTRVEEQVAAAVRVQASITSRQDRGDARIEATLTEIRRELTRINDKLDEKADRGGRKQ